MNKIIVLFITAFLITSCMSTNINSINNEDQSENEYKTAQVLFDQKRYDESLSIAKKSLSHNNRNINSILLVAVIYQNQRNVEQSKSYYLDAINQEPHNPDYYYFVAELLSKNNDPLSAIDYYKKNLNLRNDNWKCLLKMANCYFRTKQYDEAIATYSEVLKYKIQIEKSEYKIEDINNMIEAIEKIKNK